MHLSDMGGLEKVAPDVPLADGLDAAAFGDDPMFVTLPIAQIGAVSRNGYRYTEMAVRGLVAQINQKKPEGHWGHVPAEQRDTHYQPPAVRWVGAVLDAEGVAWGKAIPISLEAREHFRVANAAQAAIGTSLYGVATIEGDAVIALELESIDLADAARAGVIEAVAAPLITAEMTDALGSKPMAMDGKSPLKQAAENPLSGETLPTPPAYEEGGLVRRILMEQASLLRQSGIVVEAATADIVRGLIDRLAHLHTLHLLAQIQGIITETVQLPPLRAVIAEMMGLPEPGGDRERFVRRWQGVIAEMGAAENPDLLREAVQAEVVALLGRPSVQGVARALIHELAGPSVLVGARQPHPQTPAATNPTAGRWDTPEKRAEVRSRFGF